MKCPACGFHSYAYDNCKKCGADLSGVKGKHVRHAAPPAQIAKKKENKPPVKKEVVPPGKAPMAPASEPASESRKTLKSPPPSVKTETAAELVPPGKVEVGFAARIMAKFKPDNRDETASHEGTLEEVTPKRVISSEPLPPLPVKSKPASRPKTTPTPTALPQPPGQAVVETPARVKKVRKSVPSKRSPVQSPAPEQRSAPQLIETDTFAQGLDDLPDIVSVTPLPHTERLVEGQGPAGEEASANFVQRAKEGVGRLLSRFSHKPEDAEDVTFSIVDPHEEDESLPPLPTERGTSVVAPAVVTGANPPAARKRSPSPLGTTEPEFTIDADIEPLNPASANVPTKPSLSACKGLPPLPTSYNSPPGVASGTSLPPLSSGSLGAGLPPLPAASVLPTIITATIEEKKPIPDDEEGDSDFNAVTFDPFADDE